MNRKLYRDSTYKILGGVASGLAEYLNTDITLVRILFIIAGFWHHFMGSAAILIYILLWIVLPDKNKILDNPNAFKGNNPGPGPNDPDFEVNYRVDESGNAAPHFTASGVAGPTSNSSGYQRNQVGGIILVMIGVLFLIDEFVNLDFTFIDRYWPVGLIGLGIILIISTNQSKSKTV